MWFRQIFDFRVKDLKFSIFVKIFIKFVQFWSKIEILWSRVNDLKFWFSLGLRISNFTKSPKSKFSQNRQILSKTILNITNFLWVLGRRARKQARSYATKNNRYRKNSSSTVNAAVGAVNSVVNAIVEFRQSDIANATALQQISAFEVDNEEAIVGNIAAPTADEIKVRAIDNYAAQNRAVTKQDYLAILYRMPSKFGAIKRANISQDSNSSKRNLNLYVVAENQNGNLANASDSLKENVKQWLNHYKMINDSIDILDAGIVNIGINFELVGELEKDFTLVLNDAIDALKQKYTTKFNLGEPIYISDIYSTLNDVDGVVDTKNVQIVRKFGAGYSSVQYDIDSNTTADERLVRIPENLIFEIKDLDSDIVGEIR